MDTTRKHDDGLEALLKKPHKMGIRSGHMIIAKEVRFLDAGNIRAEPDFMIIQDGVCTLIEYKCTHSDKQYEKATKQLNRAEQYLRDHKFKYDDIRKIYVPGDSDPQIIGGN